MTTAQLHDNRLRIGRQIAAAREIAGMTQDQLSDATGIFQSNINRIEKGKYNVGLDILSRMAAVLGCEIYFEPAK